MMVLGPGLGTLVGTLCQMPMCAFEAHVHDPVASDARSRKARRIRR